MTESKAPVGLPVSASILETRHAQVFPTLTAEEVMRLQRFGVVRHWHDGEVVLQTGKASPGMHVVLSGALRLTRRDGHGHDIPIVTHGPGHFTGEVGQLSETRSLVDAQAVGETNTLLLAPVRLRALLVAEADLGERIMRAFILRRVSLIQDGAGGPVIIGAPSLEGVARLRNFLTRNGMPHLFFDPATDPDAAHIVERYAPAAEDLPLVVCPDGSVLRNPTEGRLAACIGMLDIEEEHPVYDVVIVGAGPAGLSTAVYAGSEGLSVLVIDARSFGGQAGASARIENYLGFPTGISGQALTGRAFNQALKFGAHMLIPAEVVDLRCADAPEPLTLRLRDGRRVRGRSVVIASGARYRRPACTNLLAMEGHGVWYWASSLEARLCARQEVALVGGGNSAGQAAVFLASHAAKVWMLVRGDGLAASMSRYLIDRIASIANIELCTRTEIAGLSGTPESGVEAVRWVNRASGRVEEHSIRNVFMFLGADPTTEWLARCDVERDAAGFVVTGGNGSRGAAALTSPGSLQTSVPGVFAIGDVRAGSVKRVGGAIGEGAAVVAQIHGFLAAHAAVQPGG